MNVCNKNFNIFGMFYIVHCWETHVCVAFLPIFEICS